MLTMACMWKKISLVKWKIWLDPTSRLFYLDFSWWGRRFIADIFGKVGSHSFSLSLFRHFAGIRIV